MELSGTHGMVATTHWLATAAGMGVLEKGGNAFDAAVTAGFVLQVVEPHLCGPGGDLPAIVSVRGGDPIVLCAQGVTPARATVEHYVGEGLDVIPGNGLLAACVPGAWDGWLTLLRDHGTIELADALAPAISYARHGFPVIPTIAATVTRVEDLFRAHWPTSAAQWLAPAPKPGELFRLPVLADTWERIVREAGVGGTREQRVDRARAVWSQGFVAEAIDGFARRSFRDDSGADHAGVLTGNDLAGWHATYEDPLTVDAGDGWTLAKCGPWSQGPALAQQVQLLRGLPVEYVDGVPTAGTVHAAVEVAKLAFADREAWYGDGARIDGLFDDERVAARRGLVGASASLELRPGPLDGREPVLSRYTRGGGGLGGYDGQPPLGDTPAPAVADPAARGDTVHVDVVDAAGNMISATPSGGWLQSSPTIPELGFCLGTRTQMCWLEDGLPNSLRPGVRPRTTLSPSMALRDGVPTLAFGTPGGDQQDQWQLCFWLAHTAGGLNLWDAIHAPAWHTAAFPSSFYPRAFRPGEVTVESRLGEDAIADLRRRGHTVVDSGPWSLGRLSAVSRDPATGVLRAAANSRGKQGWAAGR